MLRGIPDFLLALALPTYTGIMHHVVIVVVLILSTLSLI